MGSQAGRHAGAIWVFWPCTTGGLSDRTLNGWRNEAPTRSPFLGGRIKMGSVLITGARAPVALHWAQILASAGKTVILADSLQFPFARFSRAVHAYERLPSPRDDLAGYRDAVLRVITAYDCELIVPTCEEVFFLAALRDLHGVFLPLFAPNFARLENAHNKYAFSKFAGTLHGAHLPTELIVNKADLEKFNKVSRDFVFKPVWSRFGDRALIRPGPGRLQRISPTSVDPWIAQLYLPGEELCCWAMGKEGGLLGLQAYRPLYRVGQGASLAFEAVKDPAIEEFVHSFIAATQWTGQVSFDFRRSASGQLFPIECNPRATSGLHFFTSSDRLHCSLFEGTKSRASSTNQLTLPLAMWVYGLPDALRHNRLTAWWRDFAAMSDLTKWQGDRSLLPMQFLSLAEIVAKAVARRIGLKQAATADIEWNGERLDQHLTIP